MLKISRSTKSITWPRESGVEVNSNNKAEYNIKCKLSSSKFDSNKIKDNEIGKKY